MLMKRIMRKQNNICGNYGTAIHRDFVPLFVDDYYAHMFGYDNAAQVMALPSLLTLFCEHDRQQALQNYAAIMAGKMRPKVAGYQNRDRFGQLCSVISIDHLCQWQGAPALQITLIDVSQQVAAKQALQQSEQRYRSLVESSLQGILVHRFFKPLYGNQALADLVGFSHVEPLLALPSLLALIPEDNQQQAIELHERLLLGEMESHSVVTEYLRQDGDSVWLNISESLVSWEGEPAVQSVMMDVTQLHRQQQRLEFQANHDVLTGLMNRRSMNQVLVTEFAMSKRSDNPLCCLILDIDDFKQINDQYGHAIGDDVLRMFAIESLKVLRDGDFLARWGGEEFLLLLPNTAQSSAMLIAQRVRQHLEQSPITVNGQHHFWSVSIGLAMLTENDASPESLIVRADSALYIAKQRGKNQVALAPQFYQL